MLVSRVSLQWLPECWCSSYWVASLSYCFVILFIQLNSMAFALRQTLLCSISWARSSVCLEPHVLKISFPGCSIVLSLHWQFSSLVCSEVASLEVLLAWGGLCLGWVKVLDPTVSTSVRSNVGWWGALGVQVLNVYWAQMSAFTVAWTRMCWFTFKPTPTALVLLWSAGTLLSWKHAGKL